jgi:hypothetical protein
MIIYLSSLIFNHNISILQERAEVFFITSLIDFVVLCSLMLGMGFGDLRVVLISIIYYQVIE